MGTIIINPIIPKILEIQNDHVEIFRHMILGTFNTYYKAKSYVLKFNDKSGQANGILMISPSDVIKLYNMNYVEPSIPKSLRIIEKNYCCCRNDIIPYDCLDQHFHEIIDINYEPFSFNKYYRFINCKFDKPIIIHNPVRIDFIFSDDVFVLFIQKNTKNLIIGNLSYNISDSNDKLLKLNAGSQPTFKILC